MSIEKRHNYKNLKIGQLRLEIASDVFTIISNFPKTEQYSLVSQLSRCSFSLSSNIAEGSARTDKSFFHFLDIALGSSFELETQLIIACNRNYFDKITLTNIEEKITEFQKMTMSYQNKL